ncbi:MAG: nucleotide exchange factor GrpE [Actinomycetota bacterium]
MSGSSQADTSAPDPSATDPSGHEAGDWAKTVAEGVPGDAGGPPPPAPLGNVTPDDIIEGADGELPVTGIAEAAASATPGVGAVPGAADEPSPADDPAPSTDGRAGDAAISVEDLVLDLERVTGERDQYLDASRRLQAEFENYKKQVGKREAHARDRANDSLIGELLPVLDAFDGAVASGTEEVVPMRTSFLDALAKQGLERIDPIDVPFDPTLHEAVMHEEDADTDGPVVAEVMRAGYVWKGRVLRPAMVRTRG